MTVFGSGYVGLVSGACLADVGNHVVCVDVDPEKVERLSRGEVAIHEPGLNVIVKRNLAAGRLEFTTDARKAVAHGLVQVIAVGTPPDEDGSADLQHVLAVSRTIGECLDRYAVIVTKSTVPVGTGRRVCSEINLALQRRQVKIDFDVASNPEFLKEGAAISDFMKPDRVVVGTNSSRAVDLLKELYEPFIHNHDRLVVMDMLSSELTKYAANAMLATKISFMNELANIAERVGADIEQVRVGIGSDPRIGYSFIYPGVGYGGSCFPKDVQALVRSAADVKYEPRLLRAVEAVNQDQKGILVRKIREHFGQSLHGMIFAIWGLAFKPNTDDMRQAPSLKIIGELLAHGASVRVFDPAAMVEAGRILAGVSGVEFSADSYDALSGADALVVVTEWKEFRSPDFGRIREALKHPTIFDGRNIYSPAVMRREGFNYYSVGRSSSPE